MHRLNRVFAVAALAVGIPVAAHANLIADGDFSAPSGGGSFVTYAGGSAMGPWNVTGNSIDLIGGYWQAPNGVGGSVDLDGDHPGGLTQSFATTIGATYTVSFYLSGNPDGGPPLKILDVSTGGPTSTFTFDTQAAGNTHSDMEYVFESFTFTALGTTTTLSFTSGDTDAAFPNAAFGPVIGDIVVAAVPEPASLALLGGALLGFGVVHRRRRRVS